MKKVNYILATGLIQQPEIVTNLAQAIEVNPNLGAFLADPIMPNPTFEEVQNRVYQHWSSKKELLEFSFQLDSDFSWRCKVKYQYPVFYKTREDAAQYNGSCQTLKDDTYNIPGVYQDTDFFAW